MLSIEFQIMLGALLVLLVYHALMFARLAFGKRMVEPDRERPISVVICARNEARTLEELVPLLMQQDHRAFEVVVVNDRSDDDRQALGEALAERPRGQRIGLQRQMRAMRFGGGADRHHDYDIRREPRLGLRPGQVFEPSSSILGHRLTLP